jgi:hypothetical protein
MAIRFHDPRPPTSAASDAYTVTGQHNRPLTIGLLANGFPDSMTFLDALAAELASRRPGVAFVRVEKVSPPTPLTDEQHRMLTEDCVGVVAAYGH